MTWTKSIFFLYIVSFLIHLQLGNYFASNFRKYFGIVFAGFVGHSCCNRCRTVGCITYADIDLYAICRFLLFHCRCFYAFRSFEVQTKSKEYSYWRQNETSFVMTGISFLFPTCFEILGLLEKYHPRKQLRWQLGR